MNNFVKALENKIEALNNARIGHVKAIAAIDTKLELLRELYAEEAEESAVEAPTTRKKRKPGRPKGSTSKKAVAKKSIGSPKHAVDDDLYQEAVRQLGSTEEGGTSVDLQERMVKRFNPQPRPTRSLGPGITAGTKKQVEAAQNARKIDASISIDEGE